MKSDLSVPLDVRLMNSTASVLFLLCSLLLALALLSWMSRLGVFAIRGISVTGDLAHNNAPTLRANVTPRLSGTFLNMDLAATRRAFEAVPWVRRAVVQREFPNRLKVQLQEHKVLAYWGAEGDSTLLNSYGEVFEADPGEIEPDTLPRLNGPAGQSAQVLAMYLALIALFEKMELSLDLVELSARGGWRVHLDSGAALELGTGTQTEVLTRTQRFLATLTQVTARYGRRPDALETADLRHPDGYAIRLRGVSTLVNADSKK
jgi:cell division protein FtsQ